MSRLIDIAKYQGIAVEKEIIVDAGEKYKQLLDHVRENLQKEHKEIFLGSIFDSNVQKVAKDWIAIYIRDWVKKHGLIEKYTKIEELIDAIAYDILDISILRPLVDLRGVTDIYVDGYDDIYYDNYLEGRQQYKEKFKNEEEMLFVMKKIAQAAGDNLTADNPVVNAQIGNNRFNLILKKSMLGVGDKHYMAIRVHRDEQLTREELVESGIITEEGADFVKDIAKCDKIAGIVAGPTGAGKTTTLDTLILANIDPWERQDIIQDENELRAKAKRPHQKIVELFTKEATNEKANFTIARLIEEIALRNKPYRIIIGEIRKGADGEKLLYANETGHLGWTTGHAGSARGTIRRFGKMIRTTRPNATIEEIEDDIFSLIDIIIFIDLIKIGGIKKRRVTEIVELYQDENFNNELIHIFKYDTKDGKLKRVNPISNTLAEKMGKCEVNPDRWIKV